MYLSIYGQRYLLRLMYFFVDFVVLVRDNVVSFLVRLQDHIVFKRLYFEGLKEW